jgi:pimeloyl-ACP methyl ester carboxylesterase
MPSVDTRGVRIHYELEGQGPPLVLMHGFSGNHTSWYGYGFVDGLKDDYQLILIDARGHGQSAKPHEPPAYDYQHLVDDVIAVLDDIELPATHYLGYSMGGVIGFGLAKHYPQRLRSLIIGGASPYDRDEPGTGSPLLDMYEEAAEHGNEALIAGIKALFGTITPQYEERLRNADVRAGLALLRWQRDHQLDFGINLLDMKIPMLLYVGERDEPAYTEAQEAIGVLPNARFIGLPGMNHVAASGASQILVPYIKEFLAKIR